MKGDDARVVALAQSAIGGVTGAWPRACALEKSVYSSIHKKNFSQAFATATGLIMAAAVSDYAPDQVAGHKLKKSGNQALTLTLTPTIDILKTMSATKTADQWTVGFAAETNDLAQNAQTKLVAKGCDMLVVNDVSRSDIGMGSDHNEVTLYLPNHEAILVPKTSKSLIARQLLLRLAQHVLSKPLVATP